MFGLLSLFSINRSMQQAANTTFWVLPSGACPAPGQAGWVWTGGIQAAPVPAHAGQAVPVVPVAGMNPMPPRAAGKPPRPGPQRPPRWAPQRRPPPPGRPKQPGFGTRPGASRFQRCLQAGSGRDWLNSPRGWDSENSSKRNPPQSPRKAETPSPTLPLDCDKRSKEGSGELNRWNVERLFQLWRRKEGRFAIVSEEPGGSCRRLFFTPETLRGVSRHGLPRQRRLKKCRRGGD